MKVRRGLTIRRMVELSQISRSSFYRYQPGAPPRSDPDLDLRDAIQRIALEMPSYGRPRITAELRRRGWTVALRMALSRRMISAGLVHHSDRGVQYASHEYTDLLKSSQPITRREWASRITARNTNSSRNRM